VSDDGVIDDGDHGELRDPGSRAAQPVDETDLGGFIRRRFPTAEGLGVDVPDRRLIALPLGADRDRHPNGFALGPVLTTAAHTVS
jgi:hypothetical protein